MRVPGSGTIAGQTGRSCAGFLIDDQILVDCRPGIWSSLYSSEQPAQQINHILISHFHVDHIADLIPFLWRCWVLEIECRNVLSLYGPVGLLDWFGKLVVPHEDWIEDLSISICELSNAKAEVLTLNEARPYAVETLSTEHSEHSICLKVGDADGKSLFYSGDSGWDENLIKLSDTCDRLYWTRPRPVNQAVERRSG